MLQAEGPYSTGTWRYATVFLYYSKELLQAARVNPAGMAGHFYAKLEGGENTGVVSDPW